MAKPKSPKKSTKVKETVTIPSSTPSFSDSSMGVGLRKHRR